MICVLTVCLFVAGIPPRHLLFTIIKVCVFDSLGRVEGSCVRQYSQSEGGGRAGVYRFSGRRSRHGQGSSLGNRH